MTQAIQPIPQTLTGQSLVVNQAAGLTEKKARNGALTKVMSEAPHDNMPASAKNNLSTSSLSESITGGSPVVNQAEVPSFTDKMPASAKNYLSTNSLSESITGGSPVVSQAEVPSFTDKMPVRTKNYLSTNSLPESVHENYKKQLPTNEYLLVLSPHEELRSRIGQVRKEFSEAYQAPLNFGGRPHLTLLTFTQLALMEERILSRLRTIAMGYCPFKVELKDFGSYPSHSIFINVTSKLPIRGLVKEVREIQRLMKLDKEHKPHFIDEPQLTIARKLLPWQYEKGWLEYSHKSFTARFIADSMLLLKRPQGHKAWQIAERLTFQNLPVAIKQGDLFG